MSQRSISPKCGVASIFHMKPRAVALVLTMCGCAGSMGSLRPGSSMPYNSATQSSPATSSVTSFDGTYRNTIRVTGSTTLAKGTSWCETPGQPIITVAEGHFNYAVSHPNIPGDATAIFQATIAQDGSFFGQVVAGSMSGSVNGTHMEGRIDGTGCQYAFSGDRA
jgi:hypothetical protein